MIRVVLAGVAADFERIFGEATSNAYLALPRPESPDEFLARLSNLPSPDVIVLDARTEPLASLELARVLAREFPVDVFMISENAEALGLQAMRAGVRDLIPDTADVAVVGEFLASVAPSVARRAAVWGGGQTESQAVRRVGRVMTIVSPKGGVGKTTLATNLAVAMNQQMPHSTVIVDLDLQFGDVATALNLDPEFSVADAVQGPASRDTIVLKSYLTQHRTGLYVLPAPPKPEAADDITGGQVDRLLQMLATEFAYVIVDTSPGLTEHTLGALDATTDLVPMTTLGVPGVRGLRKTVDTLNALGMFTSHRHLVVNFADTRSGVSIADVEATLEAPVAAALPTSKAALASINMGVPLLEAGTRDGFTKAVRQFAAKLLPQVEQPRQRRSRVRIGR